MRMTRTILTSLLLAATLAIASAQEPQTGGNITFAFPTEPDLWAPHRVTAAQSVQFMNLLYDTLLIMDFDVATIHPHIAQEWSVSDDGLTYTFNLRDDVYFHSGRHMTAADWVWTFERLADTSHASPQTWRLGPVAGFEAPDDYTFVINMAEPYSELPGQLTMSFLAVLDHEAIERYGDDYGIVWAGGTGPFKWERWDPGEELVLVRNDAYTWGPAIHENTGPAYLDSVTRRVIPEQTTMLFELELGNIDAIINVAHSEIARLEGLSDINIVQVTPLPSVDFIALKTSRPLMGEVAVRRAISYAIDRAELAETVWFGLATPTEGLLLPTTPGFAADADWAFDDPEAARALLDEAGWVPGSDGIRVKDGQRLQITFLLIASAVNEQIALSIRSHLAAVGIDVNINLMDGSLFWGESRNESYDILRLDYGFNSGLDILDNYFHSRNLPAPNRQGWNDPRTDELLELAAVEGDDDVKNQYLAEVQHIVADNALWLPLVNVQQYYAIRSNVHDARPHGQYLLGFGKLLDAWTE